MWSLKKRYKRTYYQSRNAVTDVKHELTVTGEPGIDTGTLLHVKYD